MAGLWHKLKVRWWRIIYPPGATIERFIAPDVRRAIKILSVDKIADGQIVGQVRTSNVLYVSKGLVAKQDFGPPMVLEIATMWTWSGSAWGGLPNGKSIAEQVEDPSSDLSERGSAP